jgi:hypothetical protein
MVQLGYGILLESELGGFPHRTACIHIALIEVAMSVRPSVRLDAWNNFEVCGNYRKFVDLL